MTFRRYSMGAAAALLLALPACVNTRIIPCDAQQFQSLSNAANNYGWGDDNYIKAKNATDEKARSSFCIKAVQYRGIAYCKASYDPVYKQALLDAISLCQSEAEQLGISTAVADSSSDATSEN